MAQVRANEGLDKVRQWAQTGRMKWEGGEHGEGRRDASTHRPLDQSQKCNSEEKPCSLTKKGVGGPGTTYWDTEIVVLSL